MTIFAGYRRGDQVCFDAPGADSSTQYTLPTLPADGALRFTLLLDARVATGDTISISEIAMKRAARPANGAKRPAKAPARLELGNEPPSHWKAPCAAAPAPAPAPTQTTDPMTDEMSTLVGGAELAPGDVIEAKGLDPCGGRQWFRARVLALRTRFPPIYVKYTATLEGVTVRLALPQPVTAALHAEDVRRAV